MMNSENVIVPLNCRQCGGPVEVACEVSPTGDQQCVRFSCPYCSATREFDAPGQVLWIAMRQIGTGPETRH